MNVNNPEEKINKETSELNGMVDQMDLKTSKEYSAQLLKNTHSSQQ
jgi:hypothetical protein